MRRTLVSLRKWFRTSFHLLILLLQTNWRLFLLSLVIGLVLIYTFPQFFSTLTLKKKTAIGLVGNYTISTLPLSLQKEISLGLTTLDQNGVATSGAALSWSTSPDGKTITFNLDKTLFWQDGTKFDTSEINYNLKGVEVKRKSLYTLDFVFKEPFAPLPAIVSQPLFKQNLVGLGKNRLTAISYNGRFISTLELQNLDTGLVRTYKFYPSEKNAAAALKLGAVGEVDALHETFSLASDPHFRVTTTVSPDTEALIFLNLRKDNLSDKTLRQSLAYSLPDKFSQGETAFSSLPFNNWASSDSVKKYLQNIDLARSDVAKISSNSAHPQIILSTTSELKNVAQQISASWNNVGITSGVNVVDTLPRNFDAYLTFVSLPPDPDQYALWHSTQIGNISGYKSFKSDRLLEDGRKTFDQNERKHIYADLEKALTEDIPALFLFYPKLYTIKRL